MIIGGLERKAWCGGGIPGQGHLLSAISPGEGHLLSPFDQTASLVEEFQVCSPNQSVLRTKDAPDLALGAANDLGLTDVRDDLF